MRLKQTYKTEPCPFLKVNDTRNGNRRASPFRRMLENAAVVGLASISLVGCSRPYYRNTADKETNCLIDQKVAVSGVPDVRRIPVDRSSRMFDPFNPDRPPMPEDDPTAHRYMEWVDGKKHYPLWDVNGRTNTVESPDWWQMLPLDERGVLVLDSNTAVRLAAIHSTLYQSEVETLYLSALDVSSERFLLDNQFYAGWQASYTADGPSRRGAGGDSDSTVSTGPFSRARRPFSWQRRFATGTDLVVGLANNLSWQLSGPDSQTATTLLDFSMVQPLLRGGGRDVILERLTLAERTLLQNVRAFERYKTGFYITVTAGRQAETGPSRRGGLFGGAGLEGFTGLGGGFGTVGNLQNRTQNAAGFGGGGAVPNVGGILGLLQTQLQIKNSEENINRLQENLLRFEDALREQLTKIAPTQDTIPSLQLQVAQARQALVSAQAQLLSARTNYEAALDAFKLVLGLPPYLCVEIRDPILDQFNLIDTELVGRRSEVANLRDRVGRENTDLLNLSKSQRDTVTGQDYRTIEMSDSLKQKLADIENSTQGIYKVSQSLLDRDIPQVEQDLERLRGIIPQRQQHLNRLREIYETERDLICTLMPTRGLDNALFETEDLPKLPDILAADLKALKERIIKYGDRLKKLQVDLDRLGRDQLLDSQTDSKPNDGGSQSSDRARTRFDGVRDGAILQSQDLLAAFAEDVLAMQVLQARIRTESVSLPEVDISPREAIEIARRNRLDWMNARTSLVDSWRAIEVVADDLESVLDVVFSGDMQNRTDNPLSLRGKTGRLRVGLQWDSPMTRLQERNRYRQVLVEYQQAKRAFYTYEDSIWQTLRSELRNIRFSQYNFELQRYAVRVAAEQIIVNEDLRQIRETLSQASGPTAARDSVSALNDLLQAQNTFLNVWVFYEAQRRSLDQDLGTMHVDAENIWCDPGAISAARYMTDSQPLFISEGSSPPPTPFDLQPFSVSPSDRGESPVTVSENIDSVGTASVPELGSVPSNPPLPQNFIQPAVQSPLP
jgi:hypothetical protein